MVYPNNVLSAAAAIANAITGFGVAMYRGVIMELKVKPAGPVHPDLYPYAMSLCRRISVVWHSFMCVVMDLLG